METKWKKNFYIIWIGQAVSQLTSSVLQFAIIWYLTDHTRSGMILTMAMLMGHLPQGLLGPFVGVYIDRWNRKKIMICADLAIAAVSLILVVQGRSGPCATWIVLGVLLARAIGTAFHNPTLDAVTPQLVPENELSKCAGYTQTLQSVSMLISPAIAAVLYAAFSLGWIVILDVVGAVIAAGTVLFANIPPHSGMNNTKKIHVLQEAKEGFLILASNKGILGLVGVSMIYTVALMPVSALFPLMCMEHFGGASTEASIVEIFFSLGFMAGSILLAKWGGTKNKIYTIVISYIFMAIALLVSGFLPPEGYKVFVLMSALMGVTGPLYWGMFTPILQQSFSEEYMGRIMSITGSIRLILGPGALIISGLITDIFDESVWFIIAGILVSISTVILLSVPVIRECGQNNVS